MTTYKIILIAGQDKHVTIFLKTHIKLMFIVDVVATHGEGKDLEL